MGPWPKRDLGIAFDVMPSGQSFGDGESVVNNNNEIAAGFSWRRSDRALQSAAAGCASEIALAIAVAGSLLCMVGDVYAQDRIIQISGAKRTTIVGVTVGKTEDVRIDDAFSDVTVGDPRSRTSIR